MTTAFRLQVSYVWHMCMLNNTLLGGYLRKISLSSLRQTQLIIQHINKIAIFTAVPNKHGYIIRSTLLNYLSSWLKHADRPTFLAGWKLTEPSLPNTLWRHALTLFYQYTHLYTHKINVILSIYKIFTNGSWYNVLINTALC